MKDILNEVLLTEKRAEDILSKARSEASELKNRTEKEATRMIEDARKKARERILLAEEEAEKEAEIARKKKLEEVERENEELINKNRAGIKAIVRDIVKLIVSTGNE
jgi:vacuolar-type H+-ATPase subunit H